MAFACIVCESVCVADGGIEKQNHKPRLGHIKTSSFPPATDVGVRADTFHLASVFMHFSYVHKFRGSVANVVLHIKNHTYLHII